MIPGQTPRSAAHSRRQLAAQRIAESDARAKQHLDEIRDHYIYRCYDADDRLIYVGCTQDVGARLNVHASSWHNPASAYLNLHMVRHEVEGPIQGRRAARKREREVIVAEAPLVNVHYNNGRGLPRVPAAPIDGPVELTADTPVGRELSRIFDNWGGSK